DRAGMLGGTRSRMPRSRGPARGTGWAPDGRARGLPHTWRFRVRVQARWRTGPGHSARGAPSAGQAVPARPVGFSRPGQGPSSATALDSIPNRSKIADSMLRDPVDAVDRRVREILRFEGFPEEG